MAQIGNKKNAKLNGEWGKHVRVKAKGKTSGRRRKEAEKIIRKEISTT